MTLSTSYRDSIRRSLTNAFMKSTTPVARTLALVLSVTLLWLGLSSPARAQKWPAADADQTLKAMHDELERSRSRMQMPNLDKPYFIEYRLLDLDARIITASFGAILSSRTEHNRFMDVNIRVGNYQLDSSNFD